MTSSRPRTAESAVRAGRMQTCTALLAVCAITAFGPSASAGMTAEQARQIGEETGKRIGREVAERVARDVARETVREYQEKYASESDAGDQGLAAKVTGAVSQAMSSAGSAVKSAAETVKSAAGKVITGAVSDDLPVVSDAEPDTVYGPGPTEAPPPSALSMTPWWTTPEATSRSNLAIAFAGQLQRSDGSRRLALMFTGELSSAADVGKHVQVRDTSGRIISGDWTLAKNPRIAYFKALPDGRYTVNVETGLSDKNGRALVATAQGPVFVR